MKVRVNSTYIYHANFLDRTDGRTSPAQLKNGDEVRVINIYGCPKANVMGHCYIEKFDDPTVFLGLVHTNSLHTKAEYIAYLKGEINRLGATGRNHITREHSNQTPHSDACNICTSVKAARAQRGGTVGTLDNIQTTRRQRWAEIHGLDNI